MFEFLQTILAFLDKENIAYMLSGSVALSIYTLPRATRDFDFIISLSPVDAEKFTSAFSQGYYCDLDAIKEAIKYKSLFNIIDHKTGFKADFVILKNEPYRQHEFERRRKAEFFGNTIYMVSPEDLLLSKLIWIQDLQSGIQIEDIRNLKGMEGLDWNYIYHWLGILELNTFTLLD